MTTIAAVTAVLSVGVLTYLSRAGLILFLAERPLPLQIQRALRYVGPAVLSSHVTRVQHSTAQHQQQLTGSQMVKSADTGPPSTTTGERFRDHCIEICSSDT